MEKSRFGVRNVLALVLCLFLVLGTFTVASAEYGVLKFSERDNEDVKAVQARLSVLGYLDEDDVTGNYFNNTADAVSAFQQKAGLPINREEISVKMQEVLFGADAPVASSFTGYAELNYTDKGIDVAVMQQRLINLGYLNSTATGGYWKATKAAVAEFQAKNGFPVNGETITAAQLEWLYSASAKSKDESVIIAPTDPGISDEFIELCFNMNSDYVGRLQKRLIALGYLKEYSLNYYGSTTMDAVALFQQKAGLKVDGSIATVAMQQLLFSDEAPIIPGGSATNPSTTTPAPSTTTPAPVGDYSNYANARRDVVLKRGTQDEQVYYLTTRLVQLGYLPAGYITNSVDGKVYDAITSFQQTNGLTADGIAGRNTLTKLYGDSALPKGSTPPSKDYTDYSKASRSILIKLGTTDEEVMYLTTRLIELGYLSGSATQYASDTVINAVKTFQTKNGLAADGMAGSNTLNKLYSSSAVPAGSSPSPAPVTDYHDYTKARKDILFKLGVTDNEVMYLTTRLIDLGYLSGSAINTVNDTVVNAIRTFQSKNGLTADGMAGSLTLGRLYSTAAIPNGTSPTTPPPAKDYSDYSKARQDILFKLGVTDEEVMYLTTRLINLGYLSGSAVTNVNGTVESAIRNFQTKNGLTSDGLAGSKTLAKLYSASAIANTTTPTDTPTAAPTSGPDYSDYTKASRDLLIKYGVTDEQVMYLTTRLISLGYLTGTATNTVDTTVENAIRDFQTKNGLTTDGMAGFNTLTKLYSSSAIPASAAPVKDYSDYTKAETDLLLKYGVTDEEVMYLTTRLISLGYLTGSATDTVDNSVENAIKEFQAANELTSDGVAGSKTLTKLYSSSAKSKGKSSDVTPDLTKTLKEGDVGDQVQLLYERIIELAYSTDSAKSVFDSSLTSAVKWFQNSNSLTADGVAGPKTLAKLYSDSAISALESMIGKPGEELNPVDGELRYPKINMVVNVNFFSAEGDKYFNRETGIFADGKTATVTDVETGISYYVRRKGGYSHCDVEPLTAFDTYRMSVIYGGTWSWERHAVLVTLSNGQTLAGSANGMPHGESDISNNNMDGHTCIHFLGSKTHGSDQVDSNHQAAVSVAAGASIGVVQARINSQSK